MTAIGAKQPRMKELGTYHRVFLSDMVAVEAVEFVGSETIVRSPKFGRWAGLSYSLTDPDVNQRL